MFKNIRLVKLGVVLFSVLLTKSEGWYNLFKVFTYEGKRQKKKEIWKIKRFLLLLQCQSPWLFRGG